MEKYYWSLSPPGKSETFHSLKVSSPVQWFLYFRASSALLSKQVFCFFSAKSLSVLNSIIFSEFDCISPFITYTTPSQSMDIARSRQEQSGVCVLGLDECVSCIHQSTHSNHFSIIKRGDNRGNCSLRVIVAYDSNCRFYFKMLWISVVVTGFYCQLWGCLFALYFTVFLYCFSTVCGFYESGHGFKF